MKLMTIGPELRLAVEKVISDLHDPRFARAIVRVESKLIRNYHSECKAGNFALTSDEKKESGGEGLGPTPLEYFLAGMLFCEQVIFARHASLNNFQVDSLEMSAKGYFDRRGVYGVADVSPSFQEISVEIRVTSPEPEDRIKQAVEKVHRHCPVFNTLRKAVKITERVLLNGRELQSQTFSPPNESL